MEICAPFAGVVHFLVADGEPVDTGDALCTVESLKLEAPVLAPGPGVVRRTNSQDYVDVHGGDVMLHVEPHPAAQPTQHQPAQYNS